MKAVYIELTGSPAVLRFGEQPTPMGRFLSCQWARSSTLRSIQTLC